MMSGVRVGRENRRSAVRRTARMLRPAVAVPADIIPIANAAAAHQMLTPRQHQGWLVGCNTRCRNISELQLP